MERAPQELFPIIPPSVARLLVAVSGPSRSPCGRAARLRSSCTTPGCARAHLAPASRSWIRFMYFEQSRMMARPIDCPARLVPPPRGRTGVPGSAAIRSTVAISPSSLGTTPPRAIWYSTPRGGTAESPLAVYGTPQQLFLPGHDAVEKNPVALFQPSRDLSDVHVRGAKFLERPLYCLLRLGRVSTGEDV